MRVSANEISGCKVLKSKVLTKSSHPVRHSHQNYWFIHDIFGPIFVRGCIPEQFFTPVNENPYGPRQGAFLTNLGHCTQYFQKKKKATSKFKFETHKILLSASTNSNINSLRFLRFSSATAVCILGGILWHLKLLSTVQ